MKNLREVNDDILKDWFIYRDEDISALKSNEDKKHWIYFDEIAENILSNVPEFNKKKLYKNYVNLMTIFVIIGMKNIIEMSFCDGVELIGECFEA